MLTVKFRCPHCGEEETLQVEGIPADLVDKLLRPIAPLVAGLVFLQLLGMEGTKDESQPAPEVHS